MVSTVSEEGGREQEHQSFSEAKPYGWRFRKQRHSFSRVEEVHVRAQLVVFSACTGPIFYPKMAESGSLLGLNEMV